MINNNKNITIYNTDIRKKDGFKEIKSNLQIKFNRFIRIKFILFA